MDQAEQLETIRQYVFNLFETDATGHDYHHMKRVALMAKKIAQEEQADVFMCEAAGWLHDVGDHKLFKRPAEIKEDMQKLLKNIELQTFSIDHINSIIQSVSYTSGKRIPATLEGKIVQDADRLDALGAVGIARTFAYGGFKHQPIFSDDETERTSMRHFYDKLFKLSDMMHTQSARELAKERHQFMEQFVEHFYKEWL
ncbi:uncharacterized protein JNUCC1_03705 [Lentibacillus sp. JNUCC-1]|uniref:HD domain-containing protein n=1 Tax=Lentibacillus sp. JNUCC-1 TaxID=2654513 RepID=UPI0012E87470|nr:HD domain-containing protein [Lentibacillus sp. JNUCC-1]MUV39821.1 uncharacterized protein [Lentibacillus sp. JNUCC-1]